MKVDIRVLIFGFVAGFLAVPLFHQMASYLLWLMMPGRSFPWNMSTAQHPFGIPALINLSFWGGVWGVLFALIERWLPRRRPLYLICALLFGAVATTLAGWFIFGPLKGQAFSMARVNWIIFFINGSWGLGTGVILSLIRPRRIS